MRPWSFALALAAFIAVPAGLTAGPMPAGGLAGAAATLDSVEVVKKGGFKRGHFKARHAGRHRGFHRHRGWRGHRWHARRFHRPRIIYRVRHGHFHCHRHYRWGRIVRHCHWHRHGHH